MSDTDRSVGQAFVSECNKTLDACLRKIEHCFAQLSDDDIWWRPFPEANAIGNVILHLCGNVGQWIVSGVGGARDVRDRPAEFAARGSVAKAELLKRLSQTVGDAKAAISRADAENLLRIRHVQHEDVTGLGAAFHSVSHFEGHTHQIVYITRLRLGPKYKFQGLTATSD